MTANSVAVNAPTLQHASALPARPQFGRRAFGPQRRMSQTTLVRNVVESIIEHRQLGQYRSPSFYTHDSDTQALVQDKLEALAIVSSGAMPMAT